MKLNLLLIEKQKQIFIGAGLAAALAVGFFFFLFRPLARDLKVRSSECLSLEAEVAQARSRVFGFKTGEDKRGLISEKEVMPAIAELTQAGKSKGIQFVSVTPRSVEKREGKGFKVLPIEAEILSNYRQLSLFLGLLDELGKSLVTVESFSTLPDRDKPTQLVTTLLVHLYVGE